MWCFRRLSVTVLQEAFEAEAVQRRAAKHQALGDITNRHQHSSSRPASDTSSSSPPSTGSSSSSVRARARFSLSGHPPRAARSRSAPQLIDERCDISQCDVSCRTAGGFLLLVRGTTTTMPGTMTSRVPASPARPRDVNERQGAPGRRHGGTGRPLALHAGTRTPLLGLAFGGGRQAAAQPFAADGTSPFRGPTGLGALHTHG